jgi:hypothetical protein
VNTTIGPMELDQPGLPGMQGRLEMCEADGVELEAPHCALPSLLERQGEVERLTARLVGYCPDSAAVRLDD